MRARYAIAAIWSAPLLFWSVSPGAPQVKQGAPKTKQDSFLSGPPFTLQDLRKFVAAIAEGSFPEGRFQQAVQGRGVDMLPSDAELKQLKDAGASDALLDAIRKNAKGKAPVPPVPPVKPPVGTPKAGLLTLRCAPPECDITINGRPHGKTSQGKLEIAGLNVGDAAVDFKRDGYIGEQVTLQLRANLPTERAAKLAPSPETLRRAGGELVTRLVTRLGGDNASEEQGTFSGSGTASLWQAGGSRTDWQLKANLKISTQQALLEITGAGLRWWTGMRADRTEQGGTGKLRGGPVALEMEKIIRLFFEYQPANLITRLRSASENMRFAAEDTMPDASGNFTLKANNDARAYTMTLKPDGTPVKVTYSAASGLGSGLEAVYSEFQPVADGIYPRTTALRYVEEGQHGIEFRFNEINFQAKLTDRDFRR